jgi:hypothetical protein
MEQVAALMKKFRAHEVGWEAYERLDKGDAERGSLVAYLWGMKLAQFVKELESIRVPESLRGFGKIKRAENGSY